MRVGLWWVWLYGFSLIGLSLYATRLLPSLPDRTARPVANRARLTGSDEPNIILFTAPEPFTGLVGSRQGVAIRSWLGLSPRIRVVLFSQHSSASSFTEAFSSRVVVDPAIDFTFLGTPFFHSMIERARVYPGDISVFVDSETVLLPDFVSTLRFAHKLDNGWLLVASSRNVSHFPYQLDAAGRSWLKGNGKSVGLAELQELLSQNRPRNYCEDRVILAWNRRNFPLHNAVLPPFLYRKGVHNCWLLNEALVSGLRFVFDASWTISSFSLHDVEGSYNHQATEVTTDPEIDKSWENVGNFHLGAAYGSLVLNQFNFSSLVKVLKCDRKYVFIDVVDETFGEILNQHTSRRSREILRVWSSKKNLVCLEKFRSLSRTSDCSLGHQLHSLRPLEFPFPLETLLAMNADKNKSVVLTIAGYSYRDMLMSWVCRLHRLHVTNFVICALDRETYDFSILQGLPVFYDPSAPPNISYDDCHFGTKCFQRVTKVKSRAVLKLLKLGYNVLLSDVDVYWFSDPLPYLHSFGPAVLVGQSDEYNITGPINLPRRSNSGFYFVRSDGPTIAAMEKVVKHAATSNLSEQPSFYDTLCGEGGSNRISDHRCLEPETNLTVHFLDRNLFPNGAYLQLWEKKNVEASCRKIGCLILHNNWVNGRLKKLERQVFSGLWEYDSSKRMCLLS